MGSDWDVVIIGGGAAGIGAARRLAASGHSTLLLEASQRIGGRALTVNVAGHALDLGCGWLHSADRNPWIDIAEASGFSIDCREPAWSQQYRDLGFSASDQARPMRHTPHGTNAWSALRRKATAPPMRWNRAGSGMPISKR